MDAFFKDADGYWRADTAIVSPLIAGMFEDDV
jgi:hypothetical protein